MVKHRFVRPTDAELDILSVLWELGSGTVRDVHEILNKNRIKQVCFTTILKLMQIMTAKGIVKRDEKRRPQIYTATHSEEETQRQLTRDLVNRAFRGSAQKLVMQAISPKDVSAEELDAIRKLIDQYREDRS